MLDGINVMSRALIVVVTWQMARTTLVDPISILAAALSAVLLVATKVNSIWRSSPQVRLSDSRPRGSQKRYLNPTKPARPADASRRWKF
jgi:hypothetical protein